MNKSLCVVIFAALKFTDKHEWIRVEEGGVGTVGISHFAQVCSICISFCNVVLLFLFHLLVLFCNFAPCVALFLCGQAALGDVVYCGLPEVGTQLSQQGMEFSAHTRSQLNSVVSLFVLHDFNKISSSNTMKLV